jgi:hypothetical protein
MIVDLSNIRYLHISYSFKQNTTSVFFDLLKEARQVSSLEICVSLLISSFDNDELCKYFNKMITKLCIINSSASLIEEVCDLKEFCKNIFKYRRTPMHTW